MRTSTATLRPDAEQVVTIRPTSPGRVIGDAERPAAPPAARPDESPAVVTDDEGDRWERQPDGVYALVADEHGTLGVRRSLDYIIETYGVGSDI